MPYQAKINNYVANQGRKICIVLLLLVILCRPLLEYSAQVTTYIQEYKLNNC